MTIYFGNVVHVETPPNTAEASVIVSTAHATVETTSLSDDSLARKQYSSLMLMEDWQFWHITPRRLQDWIECTCLAKRQYFCTGRDYFRRAPEPRNFFRIGSGFCRSTNTESHLNIYQKVFVDRFLYTRVLTWTRHQNKNVFVQVNCFYVRVGLTRQKCRDGNITYHLRKHNAFLSGLFWIIELLIPFFACELRRPSSNLPNVLYSEFSGILQHDRNHGTNLSLMEVYIIAEPVPQHLNLLSLV